VATVATVLVLVVAAIHVYILVLEMFLWRTGARPARVRHRPGVRGRVGDARREPGPLQRHPRGRVDLGRRRGRSRRLPGQVFFLVAVAIAGIYGAATVNRRILLVQTVPALVALAAVVAAG
jgi:putative membrane protein